ncbi:pyridoxal 5'-phosphate synthase glutaminase subunit PdxT [Mycetocola tolaasinivorans]|uniref:Pyridoxal 5'-phosphate synthase subunit PdxT n=1 Tax=Mycetocola tolaasinivorans TaxID=76635 RepID=A0A3L6ZX01_9MICO|nr:pyridoxal 5'-phosphate synthase glutaminase subunit PdxT [Mycetocola tolaasinivorans]RLP72290.1 pyridoxal 5'-phosphate synthase glutaminase subunit PdxT [Mycetocola tolaasinivorans]
MSSSARIGVLALQGGVSEHIEALTRVGAEVVAVRTPEHLHGLDGIVLPGGESSVLDKLLRMFELRDPLTALLRGGLPAYGTCAGLILLADTVLDLAPGQQGLGGLPVTVRRNAFGSQAHSFETELAFAGIDHPVRATFIRAPLITEVGEGTDVLARLADGGVVATRYRNLLGTSFHPELTGDDSVHEYFVEMVRAAQNG